LNCEKADLLASSFRARAAAVSKLNPELSEADLALLAEPELAPPEGLLLVEPNENARLLLLPAV
jgi:hypothetical protein